MADLNIRNEIKSEIAKSGWTLTDIVKEMNRLHPEETTTPQNISNKLTRGTLKYSEALEIAAIIGKQISWIPVSNQSRNSIEHVQNSSNIMPHEQRTTPNIDDMPIYRHTTL